MKKYFKIALRNLKRNRSRTLLTISAVAFATFFAVIMRSFQLGAYDNMINNFVEMSSGFITVKHRLYGDDPALENSIEQNKKTEKAIENTPNVVSFQPNLSYFSLASYQKQSKGVLINGIDVKKKDQSAKLSDKIIKYRITEANIEKIKALDNINIEQTASKLTGKSYAKDELLLKDLKISADEMKVIKKVKKITAYPGSYLSPKDQGVILGESLAAYLQAEPGDTLVLIGTGFRAVSAAGKFPVRGIIKIANPKLDGMMIYSSLKNVQEYLSAYYDDPETEEKKYLVTGYTIDTEDRSDKALKETKEALAQKSALKDYRIKTWKESHQELAQQIESDDAGGKVIMGILYLIIAFGVFGTVLMMTAERKREMGVMIAIGMKKLQLTVMLALELLFLGFIGLLSGIFLSTPLIILGHYRPLRFSGEMADIMIRMGFEPVMPMAWFDFFILNQIFVVFIIVVAVSIYPMAAVNKLKVSDALRA